MKTNIQICGMGRCSRVQVAAMITPQRILWSQT